MARAYLTAAGVRRGRAVTADTAGLVCDLTMLHAHAAVLDDCPEGCRCDVETLICPDWVRQAVESSVR
ncbi:MAG: hypothetical protein ACRDRS_02245 [Pseudonocardiaceae bacterium]